MRFLPVLNTIILVELQNLDETLSLHSSLRLNPIEGIDEIIPAACTLMIRFDPLRLSKSALINDLAARDISQKIQRSDTLIELPVHYNGDDLQEVADHLNISVSDVIQRHINSDYIVAFTGFAPGFAYLTGGDPVFNVPRKQVPRTRIPAGAVGLAGTFSGIYPQASPGGWQIIGVTDLAMFNIERDPPALLQPGFRVKFVDADKTTIKAAPIKQNTNTQISNTTQNLQPIFRVISVAMPVTYQDLGRTNQASQGISPSGALDRHSFKTANRIVGNDDNMPALEITLGGLKLEALENTVIALSGAPCNVSVENSKNIISDRLQNSPISIQKGDIIKIAAPSSGVRSYLAMQGGFAPTPILGSVSRDTLANLGPNPLNAGDILNTTICHKMRITQLNEPLVLPLPKAGETITLNVHMGPRTDWFTKEGIDTFLNQIWEVTPQSNRIGARLNGQNAIERLQKNELPSEATACGAIQVPASGQPVLFLADHPLTGGYPVIATITDEHIDLAGQIPVGAFIRFHPISQFEELLPQVQA